MLLSHMSYSRIPDFDQIVDRINLPVLQQRKIESQLLYNVLRTSSDPLGRTLAERLNTCCDYRQYAMYPNLHTGQWDFHLEQVHRCKLLHCPLCGANRSNAWLDRFRAKIPILKNDYKLCKFLFITIGQRNCHLLELGNEISRMNHGYGRWAQRKPFDRAFGWIKSFHVTEGDRSSILWTPNTAHPHIHVLACVPGNFKVDSEIKSHLRTAWRGVMGLDYDPTFDLEVLNKKGDKYDAALAVLRYMTTPISLLKMEPDWAKGYVLQTRGHRFISSGGVLRGEDEKDTMIHIPAPAGLGGLTVSSSWYSETKLWTPDNIYSRP